MPKDCAHEQQSPVVQKAQLNPSCVQGVTIYNNVPKDRAHEQQSPVVQKALCRALLCRQHS